jgi:hypothetical protein
MLLTYLFSIRQKLSRNICSSTLFLMLRLPIRFSTSCRNPRKRLLSTPSWRSTLVSRIGRILGRTLLPSKLTRSRQRRRSSRLSRRIPETFRTQKKGTAKQDQTVLKTGEGH